MSSSGRQNHSKGLGGAFLSVRSLCCVFEGNTSYSHLFTAQRYQTAKTVLSVSAAFRADKLENYFVNEDDVPNVVQSLTEKPKLYTFNKVFKANS